MPHKLLIELGIDVRSELSAHIKPLEAIRGETYKITLSAKNIGTDNFPGAKVEELKVIYRQHGLSRASSLPDFKVSCPRIKPGAKVEFFSDDNIALDEGVAWVSATIKANDGTTTKCYQSTSSPMEPLGYWENCFYVTSSENIRIIALLEKLFKQLE